MVASAKPQLARFEREIFRSVVIEHESVQSVGERMQMTEDEVRETVARVTEALVAAGPAAETKEERQRRIELSERVVAEQLRFLVHEAANAFQRSRGEQTFVRQVGDAEPVTVRRISQGDKRYLKTAAQIAVMIAKLPAASLWQETSREPQQRIENRPPSDDQRQAVAADTQAAADKPLLNHPDRACSPAHIEQPVATMELPITGDAKSTDELISEILQRAGVSPKSENSRPVQATVGRPAKPCEKATVR
jgi:hypothetical protein